MQMGYAYSSPFLVGFDSLFSQLEELKDLSNTYPPHNIIRLDDDSYTIELAVAGFKPSDIEIELKDQLLSICGEKEDTRAYSYRGISSKRFSKSFRLAEYVEVMETILAEGILSITLKHTIPEDKKPKKIAIKHG